MARTKVNAKTASVKKKVSKPLFIVTEKNGKKYITTPAMETGFVALSKPSTHFDKNGIYSVTMRVEADSPEGRELVELLDQLHAEAVEQMKEDKGKKRIKEAEPPYSEEEDADGEPTGYLKFTVSSKAGGKNKDGEWFKITPPALYDAKGKPIDRKRVNIGGGSILKVFFEASPYFVASRGAGVSLRLKAVKVIELVEFGGDGSVSAEFAGFAEEEEGFDYDPDEFVGVEDDSDSGDEEEYDEEEWDEDDDDDDEADF